MIIWNNEDYVEADWETVKEALEAAYRIWGEEPTSITSAVFQGETLWSRYQEEK